MSWSIRWRSTVLRRRSEVDALTLRPLIPWVTSLSHKVGGSVVFGNYVAMRYRQGESGVTSLFAGGTAFPHTVIRDSGIRLSTFAWVTKSRLLLLLYIIVLYRDHEVG